MNASACPICKRPAIPEYKPFCSKRCADVDLAHWFGETYALPAEPISETPMENDEA